jgi:hypothetical protein
MALDPDLRALRKEVARLLLDRRPDRYTVRDAVVDNLEAELEPSEEDAEDLPPGDETAWLDQIAADVAHLVPDEQVRKLYARKVVAQQEGSATKRANTLLRNIGRTGQLVLGWMDLEDYPIAVITRAVDAAGRVHVREERVALRAAGPPEFDAFAIEERRRAARDFGSRNDTCTGAEWLSVQMQVDHERRFDVWARRHDGGGDE